VFCPSFVSLVVLFKGVPECADVACRSRLLQRGIEILEVGNRLPTVRWHWHQTGMPVVDGTSDGHTVDNRSR